MQKEKPIFGLRTGDTAKATTAEKATMHKELLGIETATTTEEKKTKTTRYMINVYNFIAKQLDNVLSVACCLLSNVAVVVVAVAF